MKKIFKKDIDQYISYNGYYNFKNKIVLEHKYLIIKYIKLLRLDEEYSSSKNILKKCLSIFIKRKRNKLGAMLGFYIPNNVCGPGLVIWHYGSIIINGNSKIGSNCQLHGNNCIGNKGVGNEEAPIIGDNVDIGFGACIIGGITIANNCKIGAGAIVTKDVLIPGSVVIGEKAHIK